VGYITVNVDVDVDLYDIDTEDLREELERRGGSLSDNDWEDGDNKNLLNIIYESRRLGKDYQKELDTLIFRVLGRII
jgi:hypothetical protein